MTYILQDKDDIDHKIFAIIMTLHLNQALAYILQHKDDIDHKIFEIIMAHLNKAIDKVAGSSSYAFDEMDEGKDLGVVIVISTCSLILFIQWFC